MLILREMLSFERQELTDLCKAQKNPTIRSFPNYWTWFRNWDTHPPLVLVEEGKGIIGFIGFVLQKSKEYVNLYGFAVRPEEQRKGLGSLMFEEMLYIAHCAGVKRVKTRADERFPGYQFFYKKLGWNPIAKIGREWIFDAKVFPTLEEFKENLPRFYEGIPVKQMEKYLKMDRCALTKEFLGKFPWR